MADEQEETAEKSEDQESEGREEMEKLEQADEVPKDPADWPDGKAKYLTFGGREGEHGYDEGPEEKLGPSSLEHHEDGSVSIEGEKVDDPDEYKGEPIPGGPTDPNAPALAGEDDKNEAGDGDKQSDDSGDSAA